MCTGYSWEFQSTPPRGRRPQFLPAVFPHTYNFNPLRREGGDEIYNKSVGSGSAFQSTPPRGRRLLIFGGWNMIERFQSTPPRGRRRTPCPGRGHGSDFNPLRREGGDKDSLSVLVVGHAFQSTPPRGRRPRNLASFFVGAVFQSTPPRGRRRKNVDINSCSPLISIHSAARAETKTLMRNTRRPVNFNPLRREGGDDLSARTSTLLQNFNPLRREGGDA